ncbi:MAG: pyridoxal 5'-phosphate synthase glutaminase subunit PdxT [Methanobacteriota archaeon]
MKRIGVLSVQGDVSEHTTFLSKVCTSDFEVCEVKTKKTIEKVDALVFPGGESTTIGKLLREYEVDVVLKKLASEGIPILGTCAGLVLLAKEGDELIEKTRQPLLEVVDIKVSRNAFGPQRESFEHALEIPVLGGKSYPGVFIRAPAIDKSWGKVKSLCEFEGRIVAAQQENIIVTAFHPELSGDMRLHEYFLDLI